MDAITPIIPFDSLKDTIAILVILLALPQPLSLVILSLYILFSSSKAFVSKVFTKLFKSSAPSITSTIGTTQSQSSISNSTSTTDSSSSFISPFGLIILFDLTLGALLKSTAPNITKVVFVLSKSIIAASLSGNQLKISFISCIFIIVLDHLFKLGVLYLDSNFGIRITVNPYLFPYLSNVNFQFSSILRNLFYMLYYRKSFISNYSHFNYTEFSIKFLTYLINYFNLLLSIHVILMAFASTFKKNFISKSINQLTSDLNNISNSTNNNSIVLNNKDDKNQILEIKICDELSNSSIPMENEEIIKGDDAPASYPQESTNSDLDSVSTSTIVAENFEMFVNSSFTKPKNSIKSIQPLWALVATAKAMSLRKDIYSGEVEINKNDNSLILSDYVNKYDEYKFANFEEDSTNFYNKRISIFINYIGETLISFQLKNYNQGLIIIRVNGVIWYQVSTGEFNGEEYFIVGGLTPSSQYDIQFIIEDEDHLGDKKKYLIDDLIVSTTDVNGVAKSNSTSKVLSPLITLQESLITTNDNLLKEKLKLKKTRKEISKKISSYKQDIEILKSKISNSDKNDEKNWKKVLSLRTSVKQVEEDFSKIEKETSEIETKENEINEIYLVEKRKFETFSRNFTNFKNQFNEKLSVKRLNLNELNLEIENTQSKKDKLINKLEKLKNDLINIDKELDDVFQNDLTKRLNLRNKRMEKRELLLNEFKKEIEKMQEGVLKYSKENDLLRREVDK